MPTSMVTLARDWFGISACDASPARYRLEFAVVHPATTTMTKPEAPRAKKATSPGSTISMLRFIMAAVAAPIRPAEIQAT